MIANSDVVVGGHWLRLAAQDRYPLGISSPGKIADNGSIFRHRTTQPRTDRVRHDESGLSDDWFCTVVSSGDHLKMCSAAYCSSMIVLASTIRPSAMASA